MGARISGLQSFQGWRSDARCRNWAAWVILTAGLLIPGGQGLSYSFGLARAGEPDSTARFPLSRLSSGGYSLLTLTPPRQAETASVRVLTGASSLAGLDPKVGANLRLGEDPTSLPSDRLAQAEPHLARSYTDTNLFVATFQEGRYSDGGAVDNGFAISRDGGRSWRRGLIPHLIKSVDGGAFDRASDPVAGVSHKGVVYLNSLAIRRVNGASLSTLVLSKSTNAGETFSRPLTVVTSASDMVFLDKNWMAVNTFPGTPKEGRIAVTYTRFDSTPQTGTNNPIAITLSDDEGETWTSSQVISPPSCQGSQPVFFPDGSLSVVYWNFDTPSGYRVESVFSSDGGLSFGEATRVANVTLYSDPVARDGAFLPSATVDRTLGVLYVVYQAYSGGPRVLFTRSRDRGKTWTTPVRVNDTPGNRSVFNPAIAVSPEGQHVSIIFYDKRNDDGTGQWVDLYLAESFDGGDTWEPNLRISSASSFLGYAPLAPDKRMLGDYLGIVPGLSFEAPAAAVWVDTRTGSVDPYLSLIRRSRGSSFAAWQRLVFSSAELGIGGAGREEADPDGDGIPNLLEYALGSDPHQKDRQPGVDLVLPGAGGVQVTLKVSQVMQDVEFLWLGSSNLLGWGNAVPTVSSEQVNMRPDLLELHYLLPGPGSSGFYRLGGVRR